VSVEVSPGLIAAHASPLPRCSLSRFQRPRHDFNSMVVVCQHALHAERDILLANPSVRPSLRLSVRLSVTLCSGIVSKRMNISPNSVHLLVAA